MLIFSQDTMKYWIDADSSYMTYVYEIFRPKENGRDELHLNRIGILGEAEQTLVYVFQK